MLGSNPSAHPMAGHNQERLCDLVEGAPVPEEKVMSCPKAINPCRLKITKFQRTTTGVPFGNIFRAGRFNNETFIEATQTV